jgi:hypothetical protein
MILSFHATKVTLFPDITRKSPENLSVGLSKSKNAQAECKAKARFQALLRRSRFSGEAQRTILLSVERKGGRSRPPWLSVPPSFEFVIILMPLRRG